MKTKIKLFFLFAGLIVADQTTKYFSSNSVCNKNLAWSLPIAPAIFWFGWIAIILALICFFFKTRNYWQKLFLVIILAGAVSNIIDRIRFGCVVDFIDLKFWPIFNLADVYITIGILLFLIFNFQFSIFKK